MIGFYRDAVLPFPDVAMEGIKKTFAKCKAEKRVRDLVALRLTSADTSACSLL